MNGFLAIYQREFKALFLNYIGYVFIAAFSSVSILFAIQMGQMIESARADLWSLFQFFPWLFIVFTPLLGMRAWSDEIRTHTLDTLLSLPIPISSLVFGKFIAGYCVILLALVCTFPLWIIVNFLGPVDNGATFAAYIGVGLLAGAMLAISNAASALAKNQIIAFVIACIFCFTLSATGLPFVTQITTSLLGAKAADAIAALSLIDQFYAIARGNISLSGIIFFVTTIFVWLALAALYVDNKRSSLN